MWGLNKNARAAVEHPIGRIPREQDLSWDAVRITQIQRTGLENTDSGSVFVRGQVARPFTRRVLVISGIVRPRSVCRRIAAGRPLPRKRSLLCHRLAQAVLATFVLAFGHSPATLFSLGNCISLSDPAFDAKACPNTKHPHLRSSSRQVKGA